MGTINNIELVEFAKKAYQESWGYVWGTFGQVLTSALLEEKSRQYKTHVGNRKEFIRQRWLNRRVADCVGLIKAFLWWNGDNSNPRYNANQDLTADGYYNKAKVKGAINTLPEIPGLCLWRKGHIGVYIGNGEAIEARGTEYGVVKTEVRNGTWTHWLQSPFIEYHKVDSTDFDWAKERGYLDGKATDLVTKSETATILRIHLTDKEKEIEDIVEKAPEVKPVYSDWIYSYQGITHVAEIEPMSLKCTDMILKKGADIPFKDAINANFFLWSVARPYKTIGWLISEGKVLSERHEYLTWKGNPKGTLIVYRTGEVFVGWKWDSDIVRELNKIWFCCQGFNLFHAGLTLPEIMEKEGWLDAESLRRKAVRIAIGYNKTKNKVFATCRPESGGQRAIETMQNLGCDGAGICLDSGGSALFKCNNRVYHSTDRLLASIIHS